MSPKMKGTFFMDKIKLHEKYMKKVFSLAKKGEGLTSPNPLVGAVIVKDGQIIGEGYHKGPGTPHAEKVALELAGEKAQGSDLYVNLEPCSHYGRTPPCVEAIIKSGIKKVIISNIDPNPLVNGKGILKLQENGIKVLTGVLKGEGLRLNEVFIKYIQTGMPFIALKAAASLDGKIATSTGESKWITGEKSRENGHKLRKKYDGILVGINTIMEDDPFLTCRIPRGKNPIRIVLDSKLRISPEANVLNLEDSKEKTLIFTTAKAPEHQIEIIRKKAMVIILEEEMIDLKQVLLKLASLNIISVLIEGGSRIHSSFISEKIPDKYYLYFAPLLIGGDKATGFFGGQGFFKLEDATKLDFDSVTRIGEDIRLIMYPK